MEATGIPTDIIIYAAVAVILVVWLSRVLGTRSGAERKRPNPFVDAPQSGTPVSVTALPQAAQAMPQQTVSGTALDAALVQIALADRAFDPARFTDNAKDAFALVVTAFADADLETLKDLLAPPVYASFAAAIEQRKSAGQKVTTEVHRVGDAKIIAARLDGKTAHVTLRFKADETYVLADASGKVLAGHPDRIVTMTDVWTFTRDVKSSDPRWFVSETRDDVKEDHGMTLPEAGGTKP